MLMSNREMAEKLTSEKDGFISTFTKYNSCLLTESDLVCKVQGTLHTR